MENKYVKEDYELLQKLKTLPGQLVIIERGDFVGLREAIGRDFGMENTNTLSYYVDGQCLGTEIEDHATKDIADRLVAALKQTERPVRAVSVEGKEDIEISREEFLSDIEEGLMHLGKEVHNE